MTRTVEAHTNVARRLRIAAAVVAIMVLSYHPARAAQFTNTACGYTVMVPDGWNAESHPDGRSVVLTNFAKENLPRFKLFAPGGARIDIQMFPPYDNPIFHPGDDDDAMIADLVTPSETVLSRTSAASGAPARVITSERDIREVDAVIHRGSEVFVFMLACGSDDPNCPSYDGVLDGIIASVSFIGATPPLVSPTP